MGKTKMRSAIKLFGVAFTLLLTIALGAAFHFGFMQTLETRPVEIDSLGRATNETEEIYSTPARANSDNEPVKSTDVDSREPSDVVGGGAVSESDTDVVGTEAVAFEHRENLEFLLSSGLVFQDLLRPDAIVSAPNE